MAADADKQPASAAAHLVAIPVPITGAVDQNVKRAIDQIVARQKDKSGPRPIVILEFRPDPEGSHQASEFERALSLARHLASEQLSGVRTVAFLPQTLTGHAVLPVLACEEIVMAPDAELGRAGAGEQHIDDTMRSAYREIAERRRTIPPAVAVGMLDGSRSVFRVTTLDGVRYVTQDELDLLQQSGAVAAVESLMPAGEAVRLSGNDLRLLHGFVSHLASNQAELLAALKLPPRALQHDPSQGGSWRAIRVDVNGPINTQAVNWLIRNTQNRLTEHGGANFLCVAINSPGGSPADSLRLAHFLAALDPATVRTVAYIETQARADASLIAWGCDDIVMHESALLGGPGAISLNRGDTNDLRSSVRAIAQEKHSNWSLPFGLLDSRVAVYRYSDGQDTRFFCEEELAEQDDPGRWVQGERIETAAGLTGQAAFGLGVARYTADKVSQLRQLYQIDEELANLEPSWAHLAIERLASPRVAGILLFVAWFTLVIEMSHPGVGVAGFVSALCFLLFFWSQFLSGTAGWLEVLLFVAGVASLAIELLVLPGFGVFGFGGAALIIVSLLLASQTFVIPQNSYQFDQFASSLMTVVAGMGGAFVSLLFVRKYLPEAPVFKRLMLTTDEEDLEERQQREALADYRYLLGKRGRTTTQLTPSGKAMFGDEIVDVICYGDAISRDTDVVVQEARGSRVVVRRVDSEQV